MGLTVVGTVRQYSGALIITLTCIGAVKSIIMAATCSYSILDSAIDAAAARLGYEEVSETGIKRSSKRSCEWKGCFCRATYRFWEVTMLCHAAFGF